MAFRLDSKNNGEDGHLLRALAGWAFTGISVNGAKPVVPPTQKDELMRRSFFLQRAPDGGIRMVWTWGWGRLS